MEKRIGKINFTKGHVTITDPCYDRKITWCTAEVDNVFKGEWEASVGMKYCGEDWGDRVTRLILRAVGQEAVKTTRLPNDVGVDSGTCGVFEDKPDYLGGDWLVISSSLDLSNNDYGLALESNALRCNGAWSISGYGDGGYTVIIGTNEDDEVVQIIVEYIAEPMRTIVCHLDAVNGLHFPFQRESAGVREYLRDHDEITVGSPTQLLAVDMICEKEGYRLEVHLPDGRVATNEREGGMCAAHHYANKEFIFIDAVGPDWEMDPRAEDDASGEKPQ